MITKNLQHIRPVLKKLSLSLMVKIRGSQLYSLVLLLVAIGCSNSLLAQTANQYDFSTSNSASLVLDLNSNTVNMGSGTTQLVGSSQDDAASSVVSIGFTFKFMGTNFTQFSASSNGGIRLGGSAISGNTIGTDFPVSGQSILATYLQDIETNSNGKVHYKLVGSSPNRVLVVEFLNMRINYASTSANGTFQARLYETTNIVEYVYGAMAVAATNGGSDGRSAVIGFSNTTGNNNEISVNQTTYATTTGSSPIVNNNSSTGNITGLNSSTDGSRRSFTFFPPSVSTSPIVGAPFCAGNAVSVSFTSVGNFSSNTYTAQLSTAAGSFTGASIIGTLVSNSNAGTINGTINAGSITGSLYRIRVISSNGNVASSDNGTNISINGATTANAGSSLNTCSNSGAINITGGSSSANNSGITWSSPDGSGTFTNVNSLTLATYEPSATDIAAGSVTITLTASGVSPCVDATSSKVLTINTLPTAAAGTDLNICTSESPVNITGGSSATNQASVTWSSNGTGTFANANSLTLATYNPSAADITAGSRILTLTAVGNAGCANATSTKAINITGAPTAIAGDAINICSDISGPISITAGSSSENNAGITWSTADGTGTFTNETSLTLATYEPSAADFLAGSVTITLTATPNSPCAANATSSKTFTINNPPTASAGSAILTCSNSGVVNITTGSAATNQASITWSTSNGTGTFANANSLTLATYNPSVADQSAGTRTLVLTVIAKPGCTNATDSKLISITSAPTSVAGTNIITCANSGAINITAGASATNNDGIAWTSNGSGAFVEATSLTTATYEPSVADISAGSVIITLTATGNSPCGNAVSTKTITINPIPVAAGATICQGTNGGFLTSSTTCPTETPSSTGVTFAGAGSSSGSGTAWSNPGRVTANDNSNTSVSGTGNAFSQALIASDYGFSIPANAIIDGIEVTMGRFRSGGFFGEIQDNSVKLVKAGTAVGSNKGATSTNWPSSEGIANYGANNDTWGVSWTATEINASNFGVALVVDNTSTFSTRNANVDYVQITVSYTVPGSLNWYTASSGGFLIGSGASVNPVGAPNSGLTNSNTPGTTTYYVECSTIEGCRTPANFVIDPAPAAPVSGGNQTVCEDGNPTQTLTAIATGGIITWYDEATNGNVVTPTQTGVGTSTYYAEASDGTCSSLTRTAVTLTINAAPAAPLASDVTVCSDGNPSQTITATATGGTITWYDEFTGGNIVTNPIQTGVGTSTYYAESFNGTCSSLTRTQVVLIINPVPNAPVSGGDQIVCEDGNPTQTLTATATGGAITWYDEATNGNVVTPTQTGVGTSTYYAEASDGTCSSLTRTAVTLTINAAPSAPISGGDQIVCSDGNPTQTLTATATGGTITWYDEFSGGNVVSNPTQTGVGTSTYYAESFNGTCSSLTRTQVVLIINPVPNAPISGGDQIVCSDGNPTQTLTATATGSSITWYDASTNGNVVTPTQVGVGSSIYYAEASDGTCSSLTRTAVTLTINAVPSAPISGGDQIVCSDGNPTQTLTATATGGTITWYDEFSGGNVVSNPTQTGVGTSTYYAESFNGTCSSLTRTQVVLIINPVPNAPISGGDQIVCSDGNPTQTLTATATGSSITWYDAPTNGNVVTPTQVGVGSSIYYAEASDGTCSSLTRTAVTLTINPLPATATVSVIQPTCATATGTITVETPTSVGFEYSIGSGFQESPVFSGLTPGTYNVIVQNNFGCISAIAAIATVDPQPFVPEVPVVTGPVNVCPYLGTLDEITYTATADGATSFNWTLPPNVVTVSSTANSITLRFLSGFGAQANKQLRVTSVSVCGSSALTIYYLVAQAPGTPGVITGNTNVCELIGTANTATYTINKVTAATGYVWSAQTGTTSISHPEGTGVNDTIIVVTFDAGYTSSPITVSAFNGCGTSGSVRSIFIPRTAPSTPGLISGPTNACANILPGGSAAEYTIAAVAGATSYNWNVTPGTAIVTHPNGPGATDTIITVLFQSGFASGKVTVSATSGCGTSGVRSLNLSRLNPATPSVMDVIQLANCPNRVYSYTLASIPANSTSLNWVVPTGQGAVITSQTASSITVSYPSNAVNGVVTVQSFNNCGSSVVRTTQVKLPACPPEDFTKTGSASQNKLAIQPVKQMNDQLTVQVYPNPTVSDFKLQVLTAGKEQIQVRILDMQGREYKRITVMPHQKVSIGSDLKAGTYIAEITQGKTKSTQKLLKF